MHTHTASVTLVFQDRNIKSLRNINTVPPWLQCNT